MEVGIGILAVSEQLMQKLRKYWMACIENSARMGSNYIQSDFIVVHPNGQPISPEYIRQMLTKLQKSASLPLCRFHDLRHLWASGMLKHGVDVKATQERVGHADIARTRNSYTYVQPSSAGKAVE